MMRILMSALCALLCTAGSADAQYRVAVGGADDTVRIVRFDGNALSLERAVPLPAIDSANGVFGLVAGDDPSTLFASVGNGTPAGGLVRLSLSGAAPVYARLAAGAGALSKVPGYVIVTMNDPAQMLNKGSVWWVAMQDLKPFASVTTCKMPVTGRVLRNGTRYYAPCAMEDQLIEVDIGERRVFSRFSVAEDEEGPVDTTSVNEPQGDFMEGRVLPPTCSATDFALSGSHVWITCNRNASVAEIDASADEWKFVRRIEAGHGPYGVRTSDGKTLLVLLRQGRALLLLDRSGKQIASLPVSCANPSALELSADGRYAFTVCEGERYGELDVFDIGGRKRIASVPVGTKPRVVAILP